MDTVIYESRDKMFLSIIEEVLKDNGIACNVTGAADIGIGSAGITVKVSVSKEHAEQAINLVKQIVD